ncbi:MAG: hypothetical protein IPP06_02595 [Saprospiraceae bacterium]|nr:hypothetical protein [Candidatus Vicinibacter affinis]MBP6172423.1 hypothetical protein [Saprospiraceae bacterium]MBK6573396.1 hypothetical protein [Candidatus Vicinibacter affinis]MBK6822131.1 hypothetical protein [Candidatus Vicinibacter affinis]MBK7302075.1 hypothetical protein [Candidatus Vicinibacter affinis]
MKHCILLVCCLFYGCYSFKGTSIDPEIQFFNVEPIKDISASAPGYYPNDFAEALNNKIRRESRLVFNAANPDIVFKIKITQYSVSSQAPIAGSFTSINRLTVTLEVVCENTKNEKSNWNANFSRFEDFDASLNLNTEENRLLTNINKLLLEDIFNKAFSNW